jgi:large subunit ribosomal protein L15
MQIHDVNIGIKTYKNRKRLGRGIGSGHGKTASKGHKGHSSRQGAKYNFLFEGGQNPLIRRIPKRGFSNGYFKKQFAEVSLFDIDRAFQAGDTVDEKVLREKGIVKGRYDDGIKVLANGEITKAVTVIAEKFSATALAKIEQVGGKAIVKAD